MRLRTLRGAAVFVVVALPTTAASAGFIDIGGGWTAQWDDSLDPFVSLTALGVVGDAVFIRKTAEFTQGQQGGFFPAIPIVFRQNAFGAVSNIVIENEVITNSTGEAWTGFLMQLLDHGDATFDPDATMNSGGGGPIGFSIDPFTTGEFSTDLTTLTLGGGVVGDGEQWLPGSDPDADDQLWISVVPSDDKPFTIFTLKETPLPGPAALGLLAIAGIGMRSRRRGGGC